MGGNMRSAVNYLYEWAGAEAWKIHVINKVKKKSEIDSAQLLGEVLYLMNTKDRVDIASDTSGEQLGRTNLSIKEIKAPRWCTLFFRIKS